MSRDEEWLSTHKRTGARQLKKINRAELGNVDNWEGLNDELMACLRETFRDAPGG
jgi:hypothetical protein